ncbi:MarR family winged helix-turn-helix transcriptional regulator [Rhizobium miluonense]|nr:MarR family winged helix-turn-helix transcriptional regulator [Rhizobium miluonense]
MVSIIFARSGGPSTAALSAAKASRKYSGPIAAGVTTQSTLAVSGPLLSMLKTLEGMGYITRSAAPDDGGGRSVHFSDRGRAAYRKMADILQDIEREWAEELGEKRFSELKTLLGDLWDTPLVR